MPALQTNCTPKAQTTSCSQTSSRPLRVMCFTACRRARRRWHPTIGAICCATRSRRPAQLQAPRRGRSLWCWTCATHTSGMRGTSRAPSGPWRCRALLRRIQAGCCLAFYFQPCKEARVFETLQHEAVHSRAGSLQPDADGGARGRGAGAAARAIRGHARHDVLHRRHPLRHLLHLPAPEGASQNSMMSVVLRSACCAL